MAEQVLMEMGRVGKVGGWAIEIYSNDHNPPHFHFGPISVELRPNPPKNITELRGYVFQKDRNKVTDAILSDLLKFLLSPHKRNPDMTAYRVLQVGWTLFDDVRDLPSTPILNEEIDGVVSEMLEIAGCNK